MHRHAAIRLLSAVGLVFFAGCGGGGGGGASRVVPNPAVPAGGTNAVALPSGPQSIYVANSGTNAISEYPLTASGAAHPTRTLKLAHVPLDVAVDPFGQLFVLEQDNFPANPQIEVFAPGASGAASPIRTIAGNATLLNKPLYIAVDGLSRAYVTGYTGDNFRPGFAEVFAPLANGNTAPLATFQDGRNTSGVAVAPNGTWGVGVGSFQIPQDTNNGVALLGSPTAGPQTATSTFRLEQVFTLSLGPAIALSNDKIFSVRSQYGEDFNPVFHPAIVLVNDASSGTQLQAIQFTTSYPAGMPPSFADVTQLQNPSDIAIDAAGLIYVSNLSGCGGAGSVTVYASNANGNVAPLRIVGGPGSGISSPNGIAIGPSSAGLAR